ncbi:hypothetical protein [Actinomadura rudentiformis]|uniref:Uncharacterized protein n=1 Tax=Actinomadura rudentiformis TaxID=359158 RepID=A0A6H9YFS9_9ACTN|nr:hypothetical protein [Actinomadura rudentiformis]KAB2344418.1 hypothetical protein F8566_31295 [Actinomadura rudentiformis]
MQHAFVYDEVAILVRHWFEIDLTDSHLEHGARLELRRLVPQEPRGTESAAQKVLVDQPLWRADLFDRLDGPPGNFAAAHFHPYFTGPEPSERHYIEESPWEWLRKRLANPPGLTDLQLTTWDIEDMARDAPEIVEAARRRAATECTSAQHCFTWTRDARQAVHVMLDRLERPDLLDRDHVLPWSRPS